MTDETVKIYFYYYKYSKNYHKTYFNRGRVYYIQLIDHKLQMVKHGLMIHTCCMYIIGFGVVWPDGDIFCIKEW